MTGARAATTAIAWTVLAGVTVAPVVALVLGGAEAADGLAAAVSLSLCEAMGPVLGRTRLVGVGAAALALLLGFPAGLLLGRTDVPLGAAFRLLFAVPLVVPPLVLALAWQDLLASATPGALRGLGGTIAVLALWLFPLVAFATEALSQRISRSVEEAATLSEGRASGVLRRIVLPLLAPPVAAVTLFAFALAIGEFGVPTVLGARVYPSEVFVAFADAHDFGGAALRSLPLVGLVLLLSTAAALAGGDRVVATIGTRGLKPPMRFALGRGSRVAAAAYLGALAAVSVILPAAGLVRRTTMAALTETAAAALPAVRTSISLSTAGATVAVLIALAIVTARPSGRARLETAVLLSLFALPAAVLGLGLLRISTALRGLDHLHDLGGVAAAGLVARTTPLAACFLASVRGQIPRSLEEAAQVARLGYLETLARVLIPLMLGGLAVAWLLAFVLSLGELGTTFPLLPAGMETVPARVFAIHANAPAARTAASALLLFALAVVSTGALFVAARAVGARRR